MPHQCFVLFGYGQATYQNRAIYDARSPLSHFGVGPRARISSVGSVVSWPGDKCVVAFRIMLLLTEIKIPDGRGNQDPGGAPCDPRPCHFLVRCPYQSRYL